MRQAGRASFALGLTMLGISYFVILTPIAVLFRLLRRDTLHLRREAARESWWRPHETLGPIDSNMLHPF